MNKSCIIDLWTSKVFIPFCRSKNLSLCFKLKAKRQQNKNKIKTKTKQNKSIQIDNAKHKVIFVGRQQQNIIPEKKTYMFFRKTLLNMHRGMQSGFLSQWFVAGLLDKRRRCLYLRLHLLYRLYCF